MPTSYEEAKQIYRDRLIPAKENAKLWRWAFFAATAYAILASGIAWDAIGKIVVRVHVVEVRDHGATRIIDPSQPTALDIGQQQIAYQLEEWVTTVRSYYHNPDFMRRNWEKIYAQTTDHGIQVLRDWMPQLEEYQKENREVLVEDITSSQLTNTTWELAWKERHQNAFGKKRETHTVAGRITLSPKRLRPNNKKWLNNPTGIMVNDWVVKVQEVRKHER
jgi:type IV secretion system protein VirB5